MVPTCLTARYDGLSPASARASAAARAAGKKSDSKCERLLRSALWRAGRGFRKNVQTLKGSPDIVFTRDRVIVFCDGDFWHGKDWQARKRKLRSGANPKYWVAKIERNIERDRETTAILEADGWTVVRLWESAILADPEQMASRVISVAERIRRRA